MPLGKVTQLCHSQDLDLSLLILELILIGHLPVKSFSAIIHTKTNSCANVNAYAVLANTLHSPVVHNG